MTGAEEGLLTRAGSLFDAPGPVGVAVSGGGDSMALLDLCVRVAGARGRSLSAVTVDHGLRPEAAEEAAAVAAFCRDGGVPHEVLGWNWDGAGNLPARARAARYGLIGDWARAHGLGCVALGHTRDDVAENLLIRLRRAPGVDGLARMPDRFRRGGVEWRRPLLEVGRAELRAYLRERRIPWAEDPSNEDSAYDRARARSILGALEPLGVTRAALADIAASLGSAREALAHYAAREAERVVTEDRGDLLIERAPDPPLPAEIDRRLVRGALAWVAGPAAQPRQAALARLPVDLAPGRPRTLGGCRVSVEGGAWRIAREAGAVRDRSASTNALWDGRWRLCGPHASDLHVAALGEGIADCPDWRATGMPRASLIAGPAVWRGETLVAAPLAGRAEGWRASAEGRGNFAAFCLGD